MATLKVTAWNGETFQVLEPAATAARRAVEISEEVDGTVEIL